MEQAILQIRDKNPAWGGRKIRHLLQNVCSESIHSMRIPSASTITEVLRRHGRLNPHTCGQHKKSLRFEYEHPNDLWQMDFKGDVKLSDGTISYPLTILDDHSRFNLCEHSCANQTRETVQKQLRTAFRR